MPSAHPSVTPVLRARTALDSAVEAREHSDRECQKRMVTVQVVER